MVELASDEHSFLRDPFDEHWFDYIVFYIVTLAFTWSEMGHHSLRFISSWFMFFSLAAFQSYLWFKVFFLNLHGLKKPLAGKSLETFHLARTLFFSAYKLWPLLKSKLLLNRKHFGLHFKQIFSSLLTLN